MKVITAAIVVESKSRARTETIKINKLKPHSYIKKIKFEVVYRNDVGMFEVSDRTKTIDTLRKEVAGFFLKNESKYPIKPVTVFEVIIFLLSHTLIN